MNENSVCILQYLRSHNCMYLPFTLYPSYANFTIQSLSLIGSQQTSVHLACASPKPRQMERAASGRASGLNLMPN